MIAMRTLLVLLDKEFRQFFRNPFLPRVVIIFPLMIMFVIPWVTTLDVRHIDVAVVDHDRSQTSRRIVCKIAASDYFTLRGVEADYGAALRRLEAGDVDAILEIPDRFERSLAAADPKRVSIAANGVNALKGSLGGQYLAAVVGETLAELACECGETLQNAAPIVQNRYNPTLEYRYYMIPALMIMLLVMLCGFLPALNLVGEKEAGTIEQMNVTPVNRWTFALAKLIPFWLIGLVVLGLVMIVARVVYGLAPEGSPGAIFLAAALFVFTMSGLGFGVANGSSNMQQTMFVMFFFVMIFILMSGLITPVESMPRWAQGLTRVLPPRYFVDAMRALYLKGATIADLWVEYVALTLFALLFNGWAALSYRKQR